MHIFKFLTTFLWVTTERSINRFGPKKTGFFRSGCRLPVNLKSRQPPGCGCAENLAEKPDRTGLLNTNEDDKPIKDVIAVGLQNLVEGNKNPLSEYNEAFWNLQARR